jgi:hypothetical protein
MGLRPRCASSCVGVARAVAQVSRGHAFHSTVLWTGALFNSGEVVYSRHACPRARCDVGAPEARHGASLPRQGSLDDSAIKHLDHQRRRLEAQDHDRLPSPTLRHELSPLLTLSALHRLHGTFLAPDALVTGPPCCRRRRPPWLQATSKTSCGPWISLGAPAHDSREPSSL